jgi:hypothetical protein
VTIKRKVIGDPCHPEIGPLMVRYVMVHTHWLGVYLHHFLRSDNDRHFHDHPWSFVTILLSGGYLEHTPEGTFWRRRFSVLWRPAEWQHWVEVKRPVWTLMLRFPRRREWGFITDRGWVDWQTYDREWCE